MKQGYYWILILSDWEPAHWNGKEWKVIGNIKPLDNKIIKIGHRLIMH